ncbi:uncharacterized protein TrAtP1_010917 [Trichoderma atroviride]|uniref:uncharacterized protein n=1 Tax=Hypocrea atroviridis TaxID=63577 RepID=UPI00332ED5BB|nr:hypothetical protein TrAtP1_010917 [Trichoderma atroviride]
MGLVLGASVTSFPAARSKFFFVLVGRPSRHDSNAALVVTIVGQDHRLFRRMRSCIAARRSPSVIENRRDGDIFIWRVKNAGGPSQATGMTTPPWFDQSMKIPVRTSASHRIASSRIAIFGERLLRQTIILAVPRAIYVLFSLMLRNGSTWVVGRSSRSLQPRETHDARNSPGIPFAIVHRARQQKVVPHLRPRPLVETGLSSNWRVRRCQLPMHCAALQA